MVKSGAVSPTFNLVLWMVSSCARAGACREKSRARPARNAKARFMRDLLGCELPDAAGIIDEINGQWVAAEARFSRKREESRGGDSGGAGGRFSAQTGGSRGGR